MTASSHIATRASFARNVLTGWVSLAVEVVVAFSLTPFIVAKLGAAAYGLWSVAISLIGYLGLIDLGIRGSVGRYINHYLALDDRKALDEVVGTSVIVLCVLGCLALVASVIVGANFTTIFPKTPEELGGEMGVVLPLMAVGLGLAFMLAILTNLLAARERLYVSNGINLVALVVRTVATVAVLSAGAGMKGLAVVTIAVAAVGAGGHYWAVRRAFLGTPPSMTRFSWERLKEIGKFGIAAFVARTASTITADAAPLIGLWTLGPTAVGVYSIVLTLVQNAKRLVDQAGAAIFPSVMKAGALRDIPGLQRLYMHFLRITLTITGLIAFGLSFYGTDFLRLWVGPQFAQGGLAVAILAVGYLFAQVASTATFTLQSLDHVNTTLKVAVVQAVISVALMFVLSASTTLGVAGLALGTAVPLAIAGALVYPRLTVKLVGEDLGVLIRRALERAAMVGVGVGAVFWCVHTFLPPETWSGFAVSVTTCTVLYAILGIRVIAGPGWRQWSVAGIAKVLR
ncbi:MAG: hypothetical protein GC151_20430 [Betaproteobacteria bacterium]|nr:hypothetical protein [Betaproteobacteria bacterium]